ncbi:hypothetical protein [Kangiella marina]|uniref:Uncharacterized protein n=1 Tax=Kangiella marina TaxID=1079178 RepID=A0ABP8IKX6_9GAMM
MSVNSKIGVAALIGAVLGTLGTWLLVDKPLKVTKPTSMVVADTETVNDVKKAEAQFPEQGIDGAEKQSQQDLEQQVVLLKQQLQQVQRELKTEEATKNAAINKLKSYTESGQESNVKDASDQNSEADDYLKEVPDSHRSLISPPKSKIKTTFDRHKDFVDEGEDISWSLEKEQQITSFIQNHRRSSEIGLELVKCKKTICEVYGSTYSQDGEAISEINDGMRSQPWWDFAGSSTSSTNSEDGQYVFVIILH